MGSGSHPGDSRVVTRLSIVLDLWRQLLQMARIREILDKSFIFANVDDKQLDVLYKAMSKVQANSPGSKKRREKGIIGFPKLLH